MGFLQNIIDIAAAEAASRPPLGAPVLSAPLPQMLGPSTGEYMRERTHRIAGARFAPLMKAGGLRNGNERGHGSVWHAVEIMDGQTVEGQRYAAADAICGQYPSIMWSNADHLDILPEISCPRCVRKLERLAA